MILARPRDRFDIVIPLKMPKASRYWCHSSWNFTLCPDRSISDNFQFCKPRWTISVYVPTLLVVLFFVQIRQRDGSLVRNVTDFFRCHRCVGKTCCDLRYRMSSRRGINDTRDVIKKIVDSQLLRRITILYNCIIHDKRNNEFLINSCVCVCVYVSTELVLKLRVRLSSTVLHPAGDVIIATRMVIKLYTRPLFRVNIIIT